MARYFFHLHECGTDTIDEEGTDFPDLEAARHHARTAARAIICSEVSHGKLCLSCHIEIEDRDTGERSRVGFADAVRMTG